MLPETRPDEKTRRHTGDCGPEFRQVRSIGRDGCNSFLAADQPRAQGPQHKQHQ